MFAPIFDQPNPKSIKIRLSCFCSDVRYFQLNLRTKRFGCQTCFHIGIKFAPKSKINRQNAHPRRIDFLPQCWHWILCESGSILGPKLRPCWPLVIHETKPHQKRKTNGLGLQDALKIDSWLIFERRWVDVWSICCWYFCWCLIHVCLIFEHLKNL